jgi:hypothetical protein
MSDCGRSCRNSAHFVQFSDTAAQKSEKAKFPVDAFRQKAYGPARNSTNQFLTTDNLTLTVFVLNERAKDRPAARSATALCHAHLRAII